MLKNKFRIEVAGIDARLLDSELFEQVKYAVEGRLRKKLIIGIVGSHRSSCDAVLLTKHLQDSQPTKIPCKVINIDGLKPNQISRTLHDAICELHDKAFLKTLH